MPTSRRVPCGSWPVPTWTASSSIRMLPLPKRGRALAAFDLGTGTVVERHVGARPLFHEFGVEPQVDESSARRVQLPGGGHVVFDRTEALLAIDVNSGRARDGNCLEETALHTNREAVEVIARQLRLRDEGGVIVVDTIDLKDEANREELERCFRDALRGDRARVQVGGLGGVRPLYAHPPAPPAQRGPRGLAAPRRRTGAARDPGAARERNRGSAGDSRRFRNRGRAGVAAGGGAGGPRASRWSPIPPCRRGSGPSPFLDHPRSAATIRGFLPCTRSSTTTANSTTVRAGDVIRIDLKDLTEKEQVTFDRVLMVRGDDETRVGTPTVAGASVTATVPGRVQGQEDRGAQVQATQELPPQAGTPSAVHRSPH